tara:strand:+ start:31 stop:402 length:372 start_codon:yes stop_codon:yes gene_type:complete
MIEDFPESERVKKSDGRMYQCIGKDSYDDMCQPFNYWIEHPMVAYYDGEIIKHCPGCLLGNYYYPEEWNERTDRKINDTLEELGFPRKKGIVERLQGITNLEAVTLVTLIYVIIICLYLGGML